MVDDGDEQRHDPVFLFTETDRQRISLITERADRFQNVFLGLFAYALFIVQNAGNRTQAHPRITGNVFNAYHFPRSFWLFFSSR